MNDEKIIQVNKLSKNFKDIKAVNNISFEVRKGQIFGFLGPNGAGKSTTIKMLTTLLHPNSGEIIINGKNPVKEPDAVRKAFGIVFQDPSLDDELTAWENMEFHGVLYSIPKQIRRQRIEQLLKIVELWDRRKSFVKHYSGGMKRRLEIARGLLHHPKVLFLDEPTLGLDPQTRNNIWEHIKELNKKEQVTVFFTTHYMEEAERIADYIVIVDHGRIISQGTPSELKKKTKTKNLEDAFIKLTGRKIREEEASSMDNLRMRRRVWGRRQR
ncbi:ATP-binding cassette domain-containing protein [Candidatus Woesearchaeota archaeon]|nr:ATP-binding cassette domain-containing protein [Candidatus Woesearchaeota archaeon]